MNSNIVDQNVPLSKSEKTRQRLLSLFIQEVKKRGFDQVTMRDLAKTADLSLGAFYYHFKNKEEMVGTFYEASAESFQESAHQAASESKNFEKRLVRLLELHLEKFASDRELLIALSRNAVDPYSPLSIFGDATLKVRTRLIEAMKEIVKGSDLKVNHRLEGPLPTLLWATMMGVVLYWVYDSSKDQKKTFKLIHSGIPLVGKMLRMSRLPFASKAMKPIFELLDILL